MTTVSGNPSRYEYQCDLCSRTFNQRGKLTRHLASKTPCHEKRDLSWMKAQFDAGNIDQLLEDFDTDEENLQNIISKLDADSTLDELDEVRRSIQRLKKKKDKVVSYARIKTHENPQPSVEADIIKLSDRIDDIVRRYKLLLIV